MTGAPVRPTVEHFPATPERIQPAEDLSHLRYSRGYIFHPGGITPDVPEFWNSRQLAACTFRWDPRVSLALASSPGHEVLICGHALDPELGTTNLALIARRLHTARQESRQHYLDVLERLFGQYVVFDGEGSVFRAQSDAIASRSVFHDSSASVLASHVGLVGRTLGKPEGKYLEWVSAPHSNDFPGRSTLYEDVWLLVPNTEITLGTGEVSRIGPRPFEPLSVTEAADQIQPLLEKQVEVLMHSGREIVISASAGIDSRSSLASFSGVRDAVKVFTYTKALGTGRQAGELHRDKLAATMSSDLGIPHQMFDLNTAQAPPEEYMQVLRELSPRRSNAMISWVYHTELPHDSLHIRGQINGVGKWHFARRLHFSEPLEISARRMASLTKRGKNIKKPLDDTRWDLGEEGFQDYIDTTQLRSVPSGYRLTDLFLWEHRVANWNHAHIVESDVTFDTYQLFGSRQMIRLMLSVPEIDRVQLSLFRELIRRMEPRLLNYPLNGKPWEDPRYDLPLSSYQAGRNALSDDLKRAKSQERRYIQDNRLLRDKLTESERTIKTLEASYEALRNSKLGSIQASYWKLRSKARRRRR